MLSQKKYIVLLIIWLVPLSVQSQIQLKLVLDTDNITYKVFMKSSQAFTGSRALITTSQISIVVPHGTGNNRFVVENVYASSLNMRWRLTTRIDAPPENPEKDYLFFSFINNQTPLILFDIAPNTEVLLFSFTRKGNCNGLAYLVEPQIDAFWPPNSQNTNIGINFSVVGAGGNAYRSNFDSPPQFNIFADISSACEGSKVNFRLESNTNVSNAKFQWFVENINQNNASTTNFSYILPKENKNRDIRVSVKIEIPNTNSCEIYTTRVQTVLNVKAIPELEWASKPTGCMVFPANLKINVNQYAKIEWEKDNLILNGEKTNEITINQSGKYLAKAFLNGCENSTESVEIAGGDKIESLTANAGKDTTILEREPFRLQGKSVGGVKFNWTPHTDIQNSETLTPTIFPSENTIYKLTAEDRNGCKESDEVEIKVLPKLYIPNAFTPNNDGLNDFWEIQNISFYSENTIKIYNRWGNLLLILENYKNDWEGKLKSGDKVPAGKYNFEILTKPKNYSGTLNIIY